MGLINWIFDIYQHSKIDEIRQEAIEARLEAARVNQGVSGIAQIKHWPVLLEISRPWLGTRISSGARSGISVGQV
jgi:hypothetical protein